MGYIVLFVIMVIALWVFFDSQKHGYSVWKGLLWAIGVFFALAIFLPLYLFARHKRRKLAAATGRTQLPPSLTPCFYCGRGYEGDPKICPHCGQNVKFQA